jgi:hypothetical protein
MGYGLLPVIPSNVVFGVKLSATDEVANAKVSNVGRVPI